MVDSGIYSLRSYSNITTYGSIYNDTFTPFDPIVHRISYDSGSCTGQFKLTIILQANITYTLVVTTYSSNVIGAFAILVSGSNYISFNRIREYLYYLVNNQHQGSAWDGIIPSHPIPSHGTFFRKFCPMGWDGTKNFEHRPIPWDENFFEYPIPSHGTNTFF